MSSCFYGQCGDGIVYELLSQLQDFGLMIGIPNILIGLAFCFFGLRLFKCILFLIGFGLFFGTSAFLLLAATKSVAASLVVGLIVGIGGGILMMWLRKVVYFMFGLSLGCCVSIALNIFLIAPNVQRPDTALIISTIVLALVGGIFAVWIGDFIVILTTAISGSMQMTTGTLFAAATAFFSHGGSIKGFMIGLIAEFIILSLLGIFFQNSKKEQWRVHLGVHNTTIINNNISNDISNSNNISINMTQPQQYPGMMYPQQGNVPFMQGAPQQPFQQGVEMNSQPSFYTQPNLYPQQHAPGFPTEHAKPQEV